MGQPLKKSAELYESQKATINVEAAKVLPSILEKMEWGTNELILDHGCSTGSTCLKYFVPYAEKSNSMIYALDKCPDMIKYGSENCAHPRVKYVCGTLTDNQSPLRDLKFNKIISFYTLHYIDDYRRELRALYDSLVPGGQMYIGIKLYAHFFDLFEQLAKHEDYGLRPHWDVFVPRWIGESGDNVQVLTTACMEIGFEIKECVDREICYVCKNPGEHADLLFSQNGFAKNLSSEKHDELREIYHKYFRETETKGYKPTADSANSVYTSHCESLYLLLKKPE